MMAKIKSVTPRTNRGIPEYMPSDKPEGILMNVLSQKVKSITWAVATEENDSERFQPSLSQDIPKK